MMSYFLLVSYKIKINTIKVVKLRNETFSALSALGSVDSKI